LTTTGTIRVVVVVIIVHEVESRRSERISLLIIAKIPKVHTEWITSSKNTFE
jgi:hypothetical protein